MNLNDIGAEDAEFIPYHNGNYADPTRDKNGRSRVIPVAERQVIAWDMEGMNLAGDDRPQMPVVWGCSVDTDNPIRNPGISSLHMLQYIIDIGTRYPGAIHVGYGFRYDANMLVKDFRPDQIVKLYKTGLLHFGSASGQWRIRWIPGKTFQITLQRGKTKSTKTTVTIYDYSSFFGGKAFIKSAEQILGDDLTEDDRDTVAHGKAERGHNTWDNIGEVTHYWRSEIRLMQRVFERFRDVMCQAGFPLKDWYGPGALANYIIAQQKMRPHMTAAQMPSGLMPDAVHEAWKRAFFGGRFELFQAGYTEGPIYVYDIGSAYPFALTMVPSLAADNGEWRHCNLPDKIERFGVYRITFYAPGARLGETRPMPLPWRDKRGLITFPPAVTGWYASPEAKMLLNMPGARITEGWYWEEKDPVRPWQFLREMYAQRMRLGKQNLLSMPFKLGPNSIYGKLAQTVGWNEEKKLPPRSHALPIAAWITSMCRAMLYSVMRQHPDQIIAVETDSIITTIPPEQMRMTIGDGLGEWSAKQYDGILYLQSGLYHTKKDGEWTGVHSRGLHTNEYPPELAIDYVQSLTAGENWPPLALTTRPRFIGAGAARVAKGEFKDNHCVWKPQQREIKIGDTGKRRHIPAMCEACKNGNTPWEEPHRLVVLSPSDGRIMSAPRRLPWEDTPHPAEVIELRDALEVEADMLDIG